jgi:hypothetical protein
VRRAFSEHSVERPFEQLKLLRATHHLAVQVADVSRGGLEHLDQTPRSHAVTLSLEGERLHRSHLDGVPDQAMGGLPQQDLAR